MNEVFRSIRQQLDKRYLLLACMKMESGEVDNQIAECTVGECWLNYNVKKGGRNKSV